MSDDDPEVGSTEFWRDIKEAKKAKRAENRRLSPDRLAAAGIAFESKNHGAHLIIRHGGQAYDFWPGTGLWLMRGAKKRRRGVGNLIKVLKGSTQ